MRPLLTILLLLVAMVWIYRETAGSYLEAKSSDERGKENSAWIREIQP